jgi:hypothetical protein
MNLHAIASGSSATVNPFISATLRQSNGYTIGDDFTQVPAYIDTPLLIQVQALSGGDLQKMSGLNIQGVNNKVYFSGQGDGLVRLNRKGGDLLIFDRRTWLVVTVLEDWPDWISLAVVLQSG